MINKVCEGKHEARLLPIMDFMNYGHPAVNGFVGHFDVLIVQRNLFTPEVWAACDYWRALGKLVCADLDDDYPRLTAQNPACKFWVEDVNKVEEKAGVLPTKGLEEGLRHVDVLLSPSHMILKDWSDVVKGQYWPNYAFGAWYEGIEQKPMPADDEPIIVGWGGSVSHFDAWWFSGMREVMVPLAERFPQVRWKICGNDWRLVGWLKENMPEEMWFHQPGVPPQEWPKQVASFDVGVAPLCGAQAKQAETYDNRRSWLKAVEYLLCGVPWVGSLGPVYKELNEVGGFCVQENTAHAWLEALSCVIKNLSVYKRIAARHMQWAMENLTMEARAEEMVETLERLAAEANVRKGLRLPNIIYVGDALKAQAEATSIQAGVQHEQAA